MIDVVNNLANNRKGIFDEAGFPISPGASEILEVNERVGSRARGEG